MKTYNEGIQVRAGNRKDGTGIYAQINAIAGEDGWANNILINEAMVEEMAAEGKTAKEIYTAAIFSLEQM